jgi:hypothetical protein
MRQGGFAVLLALCWSVPPLHAQARSAPAVVALVGGTVIDTNDFGRETHDIRDSVVILRGNRIVRVGTRANTPIPRGARVVDCKEAFLLPGLVDGFAGLNSQAQANVTLYMGVTTIVGSGDDRRGVLKLDAAPSPHIYPIDSAGSQDDYSLLIHLPEWSAKLKEGKQPAELSPEDTELQLKETARRGTKAIWLGHNLTSANTKRILEECHRLRLATYGEFIATPYADGLAGGVNVLLHTTRYELGLVPEALQRPLVADPEGKAQNPAYAFLSALDPSAPRVTEYADRIKTSNAALMPTFSLQYLVLPDHRNLWKEPASAVLDPKGLHLPPDPVTGELKFPSQKMKDRVSADAAQFWKINQTMLGKHPIYLAASGASAMGTMPGISLHTELERLVRLGLTPREALAAATSNYAAQFGWKELGSIAKGKRADILILSADPTVSIANSREIRSVILDGIVLDRPALLNVSQ